MSKLTDEKLLKRATHAGRYLSVLALGSSFIFVSILSAAAFAKGMTAFMILLTATFILVASGYWALAAAAKRGNPASVEVAIVIMSAQLVMSLTISVVSAVRMGNTAETVTPEMIASILVIAALASSRNVLKELQKRGLWASAFTSARPSGHLCAIGGILLVVGLIGLDGVSLYAKSRSCDESREVIQQAHDFKNMIAGEEQTLIRAMEAMSDSYSKDKIHIALDRVSALENRMERIRTMNVQKSPLDPILQTYGGAVRQWKNCLELMRSPKPDAERARQMLALADKLRAQAVQEFNRRFDAVSSSE